MAATIPEKLYVTIQFCNNSTDGRLGFASPYTKDAAFEKRKVTQDTWAYGRGPKFTIDEDDGVSGDFSQYTAYGTRHDAAALLAGNAYPRIEKNELLDGFEVAQSIRRCRWSGNSNVIWRIVDPRGYELEISSENFARLVDCVTIVNGKINGKCCWGRDGAKNILLPEASDVFQDALSKTKKLKNSVTISSVTPGDYIDIFNRGYEGKRLRYLGKYKAVTSKDSNTNNARTLIGDINNRFLVQDDNGKIEALTSLKVGSILEKSPEPFDTGKFTESYNTGGLAIVYYGYNPVHYLTTEKVTLNDFSFALLPLDYKYDPAVGFPVTDHTAYAKKIRPMIAKYNNEFYLTTISGSLSNNANVYNDRLLLIESEAILEGKICPVTNQFLHSQRRGAPTYIDVPLTGVKYMDIATKYKEKLTIIRNHGGYY